MRHAVDDGGAILHELRTEGPVTGVVLVLRYSAQAELKLSIRKIGQADVTRVIADPIELFEDKEHQARVAAGS